MRESQMPFAAKNESHETLHDHLSTRRDPSSLDDSTVEVVDFIKSTTHVGNIPVKLSYGIIERFSEGLYSSPNKTFEELITNSYDVRKGHPSRRGRRGKHDPRGTCRPLENR